MFTFRYYFLHSVGLIKDIRSTGSVHSTFKAHERRPDTDVTEFRFNVLGVVVH